MSMQDEIQSWIGTLNTNHWLIEKQSEGLSHEQSMLATPFRANRMNWVIGHILEHRDWMLRALDQKPLLSAHEAMIYRRGSEPLQDDSEVLQLDTLLDYLRQAKDCLIVTVSGADEAFMLEVPESGVVMESHKTKNRLERIQGLIWHETYHTGQLELLRQLAGVNDAVLS